MISFKGKVKEMGVMGSDDILYRFVKVPKLERKHCDMHKFRTHKKFGGFANSDLFPSMLNRVSKELFPGGEVILDKLPEGVTVDTSAYLAVVTIKGL